MIHDMREALLPCPFCGHDTPEFERLGDRRQSCIVACGNCGCRHESSDENERNGTSWNTRAALSAPTLSPQDTVARFAIDVEKRLCKALGREWSAAGISVDSLCAEIEDTLPKPEPLVQDGEGSLSSTQAALVESLRNGGLSEDEALRVTLGLEQTLRERGVIPGNSFMAPDPTAVELLQAVDKLLKVPFHYRWLGKEIKGYLSRQAEQAPKFIGWASRLVVASFDKPEHVAVYAYKERKTDNDLPVYAGATPPSAPVAAEQEPVAHLSRKERGANVGDLDLVEDGEPVNLEFWSPPFPVYAAAPVARELSDEEIIDIWAGCSDPDQPEMSMVEFGRAVLAAQKGNGGQHG